MCPTPSHLRSHPPGAELLAIDVVNGGPRDRLRIANLLANDILRISSGLADAIAFKIVNERGRAEELDNKFLGLRNRLDMAQSVLQLIDLHVDAKRGGGP
ncbi:hypothetical protein JN531_017275 (plasmid) [Flagellatimonas centrodinii]|uniref:hypothetical protein n=1 Tax=Flagellatimonas centrodinii TaxID=2806210 RepID=UPI001FEDC9D3|nr:hypothetical protein [Flagellatimonas centrodinii]ULQ48385.1 hypothetical protein JN531_017275 [Flagellatimonas centrodinii]